MGSKFIPKTFTGEIPEYSEGSMLLDKTNKKLYFDFDNEHMAVTGGGSYTAGTGIDITDNVISVDYPTITIAAEQVIDPTEWPVRFQLTDEQAAIAENLKNNFIWVDPIEIPEYETTTGLKTLYRRDVLSSDKTSWQFSAVDDCNVLYTITYKIATKIASYKAEKLQHRLKAGENITITGDLTRWDDELTISATGGAGIFTIPATIIPQDKKDGDSEEKNEAEFEIEITEENAKKLLAYLKTGKRDAFIIGEYLDGEATGTHFGMQLIFKCDAIREERDTGDEAYYDYAAVFSLLSSSMGNSGSYELYVVYTLDPTSGEYSEFETELGATTYIEEVKGGTGITISTKDRGASPKVEINTTNAQNGQVLSYNSGSVIWATPEIDLPTYDIKTIGYTYTPSEQARTGFNLTPTFSAMPNSTTFARYCYNDCAVTFTIYTDSNGNIISSDNRSDGAAIYAQGARASVPATFMLSHDTSDSFYNVYAYNISAWDNVGKLGSYIDYKRII